MSVFFSFKKLLLNAIFEWDFSKLEKLMKQSMYYEGVLLGIFSQYLPS